MIAKQIVEFIAIKTAFMQHFIAFVAGFVVPYLRRCFYLFSFILPRFPAKNVFRTAKEQVWVLCKTNFDKRAAYAI